ncbi:hypothetical protein Dsin_004649 [Dipteronia sinensis]|uniref:RNase H type-1 domain-containing protein n=1 Tax=Dipteronia sinensis TaxID=43782 RepID=A0AAE0AW97_9ROSI|nr:hypothetical protein Dsin_004649 [Dipteronia sinensis]
MCLSGNLQTRGFIKVIVRRLLTLEEVGLGLALLSLIRDASGLVMASCSLRLPAGVDVWAANSLAILKSFQFGSECGLFPFIIESDAKRVVNWINNSSHWNSNYGTILGDIDRLSSHRSGSNVIW